MISNRKFWIAMTVFQIVFGLAVFTVTRLYYTQDTDNVGNDSTEIGQHEFVWPDGVTTTNSRQLNSSTPGPTSIEDPLELARRADEYFTRQQYDRAADSYQKLLVLGPNNAETYNNLGITLHYLGRSTEALR
ncbi:MAG: tetratricopeptide repeat protein, partial [Gammaproteobacteria bacterium]|nr:tetratricopeptide repeat protein [Gammaproteobacteria bacterium]